MTLLADGTYFATGVACLNMTAAGQPDNAASIIGLRSTDGFRWKYAGPVLPASSLPDSIIGPTENDVTLLPDGKTLMVVARADGDGLCTKSTPAGSRYHEYAMVLSQDAGASWTAPSFISGTCVRVRGSAWECVGVHVWVPAYAWSVRLRAYLYRHLHDIAKQMLQPNYTHPPTRPPPKKRCWLRTATIVKPSGKQDLAVRRCTLVWG